MSATRFTRALLRLPGRNFAAGVTTSREGLPAFEATLAQHAGYLATLQSLGLQTRVLPADERFPDGTFVEDTSIATAHGVIITRPGAASRAGEPDAIAAALAVDYPKVAHIEAPGTVDGGDICETDSGVIIGVSHRTNAAGAEQLGRWLAGIGIASTTVDIRNCATLLHLKSGISYLGDGRLAVAPGLPDWPALQAYERVTLAPEESYAANCVRINDHVLVAEGYPRFVNALVRLGYQPLLLPMSEFRKMDGGLSCLSIRY
ncbi:MAG: arginine deiminase family protein [Pseudomonadota bacterium]